MIQTFTKSIDHFLALLIFKLWGQSKQSVVLLRFGSSLNHSSFTGESSDPFSGIIMLIGVVLPEAQVSSKLRVFANGKEFSIKGSAISYSNSSVPVAICKFSINRQTL
ncbi:MAG: hypothetical protein COC19_03680 [SAR86 cluster bacterium]|uniref:Uncharacterized protein n=1 Tax=SAR86 cluster bacterium TaxID=2030880 RepID=A0A2A4MQT5_9GAMM|nr:MAG: hypothetical protein COC19_03680 [SAR86 cluster bacterium]